MLKVNSKLACGNKNLKAHFSAIPGFFAFVSKQQSKLYGNEKQQHLMEDMEEEKNVKKVEDIRSSVGYVRKPQIKTTGQITIRNITTIKSRVNGQLFFTLLVRH